MRWIAFAILGYVMILAQTSLGQVLCFRSSLGVVAPDFLAAVAVFLALHVRDPADLMIAAWTLGFALDLTTGAVPAVGPMALAYLAGARLLYGLREALFRDRLATQVLATLLFCTFAHFLWITAQSALGGHFAWREYGRLLGEMLAVAAYSAVLAPLVFWLLGKVKRLVIPVPTGRGR